MEGGSDTGWVAGKDARTVALDLKRPLFAAADEIWRRAKAAVEYEKRNENRPDVIQAATVWGAFAYAIAVGTHALDPQETEREPGLYPGEAFCDTSLIPTREDAAA